MCGETVVCTMGQFRCNSGAPQSCQIDPMTGCAFWGMTPGQPEMCGTNQVCDAPTGTCKCNNDPACGNPPMAGDFCPTEGGATHSTCVADANGCYTVTAGAACAPGTTCQTASTGTIVTAGAACGCTPALSDESGATVALNGTGCTMAQAAAGDRRGSKADDAVLTCKATGAGGCYTWQITTSCASQQLTGGTDPVTSLPACVCKKPAVDGQYFVDPDPEMSTFMTGQPTGAQFPAACRFRTLTTAFNQTMPKVTEVIAQHTTSSNVHFKTKAGSPGVSNCNAPNSCEIFPMDIPSGVHVYTSDQGSFNPQHYVIDVDATTTAGYAVRLGDKAVLEGYTVDASGTNGSGVNAGTGVIAVIASPITGGWTSTPAVAPITGRLNQVQILAKVAGTGSNAPASATNQTALLVQGQSAWQADYLSIVGGAGTGRGIVLDHATDPVAATTASLVATHLNVNLTGGTRQIDVELGTNGVSNGVNSTAGSVAADAGNILTVTNDSAGNGIDGANSLTPHNLQVGASGIGVHVFNGTATVTSVDVLPSTTTSFMGYVVEQSNSPAAMGVTVNQGSITGLGTTAGGMGVLANGGLVTVNGTHITGVTGWTGISVQQPATPASTGVMAVASAGNVTITGSATVPTLIDVVTPLGNTTATAGIVVGSGTENAIVNVVAPAANTAVPRLTINDNTKVTNYVDGIVVNNGHVVSTGANVMSVANLRDGLQVFSSLALAGTDPNDPLARVLITGASFTGNGRAGVLVRGVVPVALDTVKINGNGTPIANSALPAFPTGTGGVDVQRSQISGNTGFLVTLQNSSVSGNTGCGITLSGGEGDEINGVGGTRICGLGIGTVVGSATGGPQGVFGGSSAVGGKVSAVLKNNHVQDNTGVGLYVTEARDVDPTITAGSDDVTEVSIQNNLVTGNLKVVPSSGQEPVAGGIYFAPSDATNAACSGTACIASNLNGVLTANDIGCSDIATVANTGSILNPVYVKNHAATACTRVRMSSFLGNTVACNGRAQLSFGIPQRTSTSASGASPDGDWDISSDGSIVGVDLTMRCSAAASPNTLAGYSANASNLGLAIPGSDLNAQGQSLIHVGAFGVKWNSGTIIPGADYSAALGASPQGNNDAVSWGICVGGAPTTCPVAAQ